MTLQSIKASAQRSLEKAKLYETLYQKILDMVEAAEYGMIPESDALDQIDQILRVLEGRSS